MLWEALIKTLGALAHWEVYAAGIVYLAIVFGPMMILALVPHGEALLFANALILQPFFHAIGTITFVILVAPIALGLNEDAPWHLPWQFLSEAPTEVALDVFLLVLASFALAFVPVIGRLPSFSSLVLGVIALKMVFELAGVHGLEASDLMPGFWIGIGILAVGTAVSWVGLMLAAVVASIISSVFQSTSEEVSGMLIFPIGATLGFAPLLLYMAWLGMTLN